MLARDEFFKLWFAITISMIYPLLFFSQLPIMNLMIVVLVAIIAPPTIIGVVFNE